jgi:C-terminal processing protease CtpA/Prc
MLSITGDLHLYLRLGDQVFATGRRSVDSLYRARRLGRYFATLKQDPKGVLIGLTRDGIGYLMISSWSSQIDFDRVEALLAKINPTRGLILDVRPNSGGDERLAMRVARHFIEGSKVYAKHAQRMGPGKFGKAIERRIDGIGKSILAGPGQSEWTDVPVAVLMSGYCMSSCEAFLLMMRQAKSAVLVGQRSQGSSGNPKPHELANGVTIYVPSWKALRPDGTCFEGEGIRPDIEVQVKPKDLETRDPILERALEKLRGSSSSWPGSRGRKAAVCSRGRNCTTSDEDSLRRGVATK